MCWGEGSSEPVVGRTAARSSSGSEDDRAPKNKRKATRGRKPSESPKQKRTASKWAGLQGGRLRSLGAPPQDLYHLLM